MLSATSTASHLLPPRERLREKAFEYCQRLVEQSTRRESRCRASSPRGVSGCLWGAGAWTASVLGGGGLCVPGMNPGELGRGHSLSPAHQASVPAARPSAPSLLSAAPSSFQSRVPLTLF